MALRSPARMIVKRKRFIKGSAQRKNKDHALANQNSGNYQVTYIYTPNQKKSALSNIYTYIYK